MLFTVKEDLTLLRELKLTVNQLTFIKMLVRDYSMNESEWRRSSYAMSLEFQTLCPLSTEELVDLINREIIIDLNDTKGKIYYDCFEINTKYQRKFTLKIVGMPSELVDAYPYEIDTGQFKFFSKDASADEIGEDYLRAINKSETEHEAIMQDLAWAKHHNLLPVGLKKFIKSRYWLHIREIKTKIMPNPINNGRIG